MANTNLLDEKIKMSLSEKTKDIHPSNSMFSKIKLSINEKEEKKNMHKWHLKPKKLALLGALCIAIPITCLAAPKISSLLGLSSIGHSSLKFTNFPTPSQVEKEVGYVPKYLETLPGGFTFTDAHVGEHWIEGEDKVKQFEAKSIDFSYKGPSELKKNDTKQFLVAGTTAIDPELQKLQEEQDASNTSLSSTMYGDIELSYTNQTYKFVPADYELTEEDKLAKNQGTLEISYGSREIEFSQMESLIWYEDGIQYDITASNYNLGQDALIDMAKAIIDNN